MDEEFVSSYDVDNSSQCTYSHPGHISGVAARTVGVPISMSLFQDSLPGDRLNDDQHQLPGHQSSQDIYPIRGLNEPESADNSPYLYQDSSPNRGNISALSTPIPRITQQFSSNANSASDDNNPWGAPLRSPNLQGHCLNSQKVADHLSDARIMSVASVETHAPNSSSRAYSPPQREIKGTAPSSLELGDFYTAPHGLEVRTPIDSPIRGREGGIEPLGDYANKDQLIKGLQDQIFVLKAKNTKESAEIHRRFLNRRRNLESSLQAITFKHKEAERERATALNDLHAVKQVCAAALSRIKNLEMQLDEAIQTKQAALCDLEDSRRQTSELMLALEMASESRTITTERSPNSSHETLFPSEDCFCREITKVTKGKVGRDVILDFLRCLVSTNLRIESDEKSAPIDQPKAEVVSKPVKISPAPSLLTNPRKPSTPPMKARQSTISSPVTMMRALEDEIAEITKSQNGTCNETSEGIVDTSILGVSAPSPKSAFENPTSDALESQRISRKRAPTMTAPDVSSAQELSAVPGEGVNGHNSTSNQNDNDDLARCTQTRCLRKRRKQSNLEEGEIQESAGTRRKRKIVVPTIPPFKDA